MAPGPHQIEVPEYHLAQTGPFLVSDSPTLNNYFRQHGRKPKPASFWFLVRNESPEAHELKLAHAFISINDAREPITCRDVNGSTSDFTVAAKAQVKLLCEVPLVANDQNKLRQRDTVLRMNLPTDREPIVLEQLVRIEDFR